MIPTSYLHRLLLVPFFTLGTLLLQAQHIPGSRRIPLSPTIVTPAQAIQQPGTARKDTVPVSHATVSQPPAEDSSAPKLIEILHADKMLQLNKDSATQLLKLIGHVKLKQATTYFDADSLLLNQKSNELEAFGHVHINDNDSIHINSDYLKYFATTRKATFRKNVRLTDGKGILTTDVLDYDVNTKIGIYTTGGKVVNGATVLTSDEGLYYGDTKDIYFKKNVRLLDPAYTMATDTLLYNTESKRATFVAPTTINDGKSIIHTSDGYYDMQDGYAFFGKRPTIQDSTGTVTANTIAYDKVSGAGEALGNVVYKDTAQGMGLVANHVFFNREKKNMLATQKPVMILKQGKDSLYVAADTLYTGLVRDLYRFRQDISRFRQDTTTTISFNTPAIADSSKLRPAAPKDSLPPGLIKKALAIADSLRKKAPAAKPMSPKELARIQDSVRTAIHMATLTKDSVDREALYNKLLNTSPITRDSLHIDSLRKEALKTIAASKVPSHIDSARHEAVHALAAARDSSRLDSLRRLVLATPASTRGAHHKASRPLAYYGPPDSLVNDTTRRFIIGFHHVRIYSDSMQAKSDSLYYSDLDSIFTFYHEPVFWANHSQITGDTMQLFTKNQKPEHLYAFFNGIIINKVDSDFYNQIEGRTINGYFKDGAIDFMRAKGNAQSVYYAQDDSLRYLGVNKAEADAIDLYFQKRELYKVVFRQTVKGTSSPLRQAHPEQLKLHSFKWLEALRPKTREELFR